jgi:hypothetical protein
MKYLFIYWMWVDCTNAIPYEKFHSCDFTKTHLNEKVSSNKHNYVEKKSLLSFKNNNVISLCIDIHFIYLSKC